MRLNGLRDEVYASRISYDVFKIFGSIYERKFHKDVKESLSVIEPVLEIIDNIFLHLLEQTKSMNNSVSNSYKLAYSESSYLDSIGQLSPEKIEKSLSMFTSFSNIDHFTPSEFLVNTASEIKREGWFSENDTKNSFTNSFYSMAAAKRKLERQINWMMCSFNKKLIPELKQTNYNIASDNSISPLLYTSIIPNHNVKIIKEIEKQTDNVKSKKQWIKSQHLSLLLKNNSKESEQNLYLDTKIIPDADNLFDVLLIEKYFTNKKNTIDSVAKAMHVNPRMARYYLDASQMLGVIYRKDDCYFSTDLAKKILTYTNDDKNEIIKQIVTGVPVIKALLLFLESEGRTKFSKTDIVKFLLRSTDLSKTTASRRASTISTWMCQAKITSQCSGYFQLKEDIGQRTLLEYTGEKNEN